MRRFSRKSRKSGAGRMWPAYALVAVLWIGVSASRGTRLPDNLNDICSIFEDRGDWYKAAKKSEERWGTPKHVQMSIMQQESTFRFNAKPPRTKLLGVIPWKRQSTAYGYAQSLDSTWDWYLKDTSQKYADRDDFDDAIDFIGWYTNMSSKSAGISKWDPYNQYLAYHEGQSGWRQGSYEHKKWLKTTAKHVDVRAREWWGQLQNCEEDLNKGWWEFGS